MPSSGLSHLSSPDSSGSDSDSSSSSSSGGEETQNPPKISLTANPPTVTQNNQDHTQATQESYRADSQNDHSADAKNIHHSTDDVAQDDDDTEVNLLAQKLEADQARKRQGSGLSLENPDEFGGSLGAIDELKQFLTVSAEDASGGPVDPVFVNHDSHSQHATQMDSLVFEAAGIVGIEDELNEPRLDSVCNSTIHSAEGSLVLGNDVEDGELPSSPEAFTEPVETREVSTDSVAKIGEIYKSSEREKAIVESKKRKEKRSVQKKSDDESDVDQDGIRQKKRYKKKMKKSKYVEVAKEMNVRTEDSSSLKRQKHKKFKSEERALPSSVRAPTPSAVLPPPPSQHLARPSASAVTPESSVAKTVPSVHAVKPELAVTKCPQDPPLSSGRCPVAGLEQAGTAEGSPVVPLSPVADGSGGGAAVACPGKARRISLKDYKAKKELERQRRSQGSQEGSGSESNSGPTSQPASKEASPSPEPSKASDSPPPSAAETTLDTSEADDGVVAFKTIASEACTAAPAFETTTSVLEDSTSAAESTLSTFTAETILGTSAAETNLSTSAAETTTSASEASAEVNEMAVDELNSTSDALEMEPISDNEIEMANTADDVGNAEEAMALRDFDVLDELEESDNDTSKESGDESDSLAEDEVDQMLEEKVPNAADEATEDIEPHEKLKKLVLEERGGNLFDVLPLGWVAVTHNSGIPLYLHRYVAL